MATQEITVRGFEGERDFWALRRFLVELLPITPPGQVWDVRRWDGSYFYSSEPGLDADRAARTRIWETADGRIVAALMSEGGRELHPHVHPDVRHLEDEVIAAAEEAGAAACDPRVEILCYEHDVARRQVIEARGYARTDEWGVIRRLRYGTGPLPAPDLAPGYRMRPTADVDGDHEGLAALLNAAFGRTFHHAGETRGFQAHAPCFRREVDLVAEAPHGTLAAYAAVCWDADNRAGVFEPVCTHPEHRQRGLAKALMLEGMRRARDLGAATISVETGMMDPANALYDTLGFAEFYRGNWWRKALTAGEM